ncbi:pseudouridine synthase [Caldimonas tepidiphila]|uniref:pseudouridine synthase n=1 Tax=Caldimonas tepidiphila TaxID=2315841 RepID=UPI000E5BA973|nr:pseudouridine synthase [Caldimonas tepidiphila]
MDNSLPCPDPLPLWQDADYVAVHKPPGLLVHRSPIANRDERFALQLVRDLLGRHVFPVHRLDRGTSGVLLMALSSEAARAAAERFEAGEVRKRYVAFVRGWPADEGRIDHPLRRIEEELPRTDRGVNAEAQPALTHYRRLRRMECPLAGLPGTLPAGLAAPGHASLRYALMALQPQTGRQHQLRRHLKHIAHPIVGDASYGKGVHNRWWAARLGLQRLWLHAEALELPHPRDGTPLRLESPLAAPFNMDWQRLLEQPDWLPPAPR